ncbi:MAG: maleylpyruvate isomerase N-terminal domain-containing protein, partial [Micromonosporaceae bacterium]|nr:maleylpyruvate isomerase N-terminal domain-containing protein [Micromonosporaceae bacterium]
MPEPVAAPLIGGVALLERSVGYALGELGGLAPAELARPTPCAGWDLGDLLRHLTDSVSVMHEAGSAGRVEL